MGSHGGLDDLEGLAESGDLEHVETGSEEQVGELDGLLLQSRRRRDGGGGHDDDGSLTEGGPDQGISGASSQVLRVYMRTNRGGREGGTERGQGSSADVLFVRSHGSDKSGGEVRCGGIHQEGCGAYGQVGWIGWLENQGCCWSPSASVDSGSAVHMSAGSLSSVKLVLGSRSTPALAPLAIRELAAIRTGWGWADVSNGTAKADQGTRKQESKGEKRGGGPSRRCFGAPVKRKASQMGARLDRENALDWDRDMELGNLQVPKGPWLWLTDPCKPEQLSGYTVSWHGTVHGAP